MAAMAWPVVEGEYLVGSPSAPVAVCTLTSGELMPRVATLPGVAIVGTLQTANLGIERLVRNVAANPSIRFVLICGKESPLFKPGQALVAIHENGIDANHSIKGAVGYEPVVANLDPDLVGQFQAQIEMQDWSGVTELKDLAMRVNEIAARSQGPYTGAVAGGSAGRASTFQSLRPGGRREPLQYDPRGYFVLALDKAKGQIVVRHYSPDHRPQHEMRGRNPSSILLGLLREELITQLSHAGYIGAELEKAGIALRAGIRYEQDRPLRLPEIPEQAAPQKPAMSVAMKPEDVAQRGPGDQVEVVVEVVEALGDDALRARLLTACADEPYKVYDRSEKLAGVLIPPDTRIAMGSREDIRTGALLRVRGVIEPGGRIHAEAIAIITTVAQVR